MLREVGETVTAAVRTVRWHGVVLVLAAMTLVLGWNLVSDRDDEERVVQLRVQSTFPRISVSAVGTSNVRGTVISVTDDFAYEWGAQVRLRYGESATFVVTADISVGGTGAEHALLCRILENGRRVAPDDRAETTRKEGRASVLCKYTSTG